jgi:hypothetical protein
MTLRTDAGDIDVASYLTAERLSSGDVIVYTRIEGVPLSFKNKRHMRYWKKRCLMFLFQGQAGRQIWAQIKEHDLCTAIPPGNKEEPPNMTAKGNQ